ncbi:MAG: hypothetical protein JJ992_22905 [Planctomycetes bacterium]|nr:hypothetical protein [Planctomycetota bacterium]
MGSLLVAVSRPWYSDSWAAREDRVVYVSAEDKTADEPSEAETRIVTDPSEVSGPMLQDKIDRLAEESSRRTDEENLERLDDLSKRLGEVSSNESIDKMAGVFQTLLGTKPRADRPSEQPVEGEFDLDTAQFYEIRREQQENGAWRYLCTLVDAAGRALEVELSPEEGEPIYQTMMQIKQNPLLEQVYRKIAMPLFDKMLAGARQTARSDEGTATEAGSATVPSRAD